MATLSGIQPMTYARFVSLPNGTRIVNYDCDQCVALANQYHQGVRGLPLPSGFGSAHQWWTEFDRQPNLYNNYVRSNTPVEGALFVARGGIYDARDGHIGVVTGVGAKSFQTMEQNAGTWRYLGRYTRPAGNGLLGFLNPIGDDDMSAKAEQQIEAIYAGFFGPANVGVAKTTWARPFGEKPGEAFYGSFDVDLRTQQLVIGLQGQIAALVEALKQLGTGGGQIDMAALEAAAEKGARDALAGLTLKAEVDE